MRGNRRSYQPLRSSSGAPDDSTPIPPRMKLRRGKDEVAQWRSRAAGEFGAPATTTVRRPRVVLLEGVG